MVRGCWSRWLHATTRSPPPFLFIFVPAHCYLSHLHPLFHYPALASTTVIMIPSPAHAPLGASVPLGTAPPLHTVHSWKISPPNTPGSMAHPRRSFHATCRCDFEHIRPHPAFPRSMTLNSCSCTSLFLFRFLPLWLCSCLDVSGSFVPVMTYVVLLPLVLFIPS